MIRADTDAWFSTPNFKGYAQYFDPDRDWYFGDAELWRFKTYNLAYHEGGCYALSRGSINKLNRIYLTNEFLDPVLRGPICQICQNARCWADDLAVTACLKSVGIFATNSMDTLYRTRWNQQRKGIEYDKATRVVGIFESGTCCAEHMISFHQYKNLTTMFDDYSKLDAMYSEKSKNNWMSHSLPPKPVTFLMSVSFNDEIDEYFNIENPPKGQKIWKGVDNLWNYLDSEHPTLHQTLHPKLQPTPTTAPTTAPTLFKNREIDISISAFVGLFIIMIVFGFYQARCIDWMFCRRNAAVNTVPFY